MKRMLTILSLVAMVLTSGLQVHAAGETGHSDWMRIMFQVFGLDAELAQHLSAINQGVDNVPGSAATKSGVASEILHFSRVITKTDLATLVKAMKDIESEHHDISFKSKVILAVKRVAMVKSLGDSTGAISNAASVEYLNRAVINGDLIGQGIGTHVALDAQGFHNGYKGALHVPLAGLERVPVVGTVLNLVTTLPFGHLVDGTAVDRLSVGKMALSFYTMGDFIVTMRKSLKDVGVNKEWLGYLQSQGVDVDSPESIAKWFFAQPEISKILQEQFPANKTQDYFNVVLKEVAENLVKMGFFNDQAQMEVLLNEISNSREEYQRAVNKNTTYEQLAMRDLIKKAKQRGLLNEKTVIRETITDYFAIPDNKDFKPFRKFVEQRRADLLARTEKIDDLIQIPWTNNLPEYVQDELDKLHGDLSTRTPFSENWVYDQIAEKLTRNMVHYRFSRFNTAYMNQDLESSHVEIERKAVVAMESVILKLSNSEALPGKYFYKPAPEHRSKMLSELFNFDNYRGLNSLEAIVKATDIIIKTKLIEGSSIVSLPATVKFKIFLKTFGYLATKKVSPITTKGGYFLRNKDLQEMAVQYLAEQKPDGILSAEDYAKIKAFNAELNRRYNSDEAVGMVQKGAAFVQKAALRFMPKQVQAGSTIRCEALFN